MALSASIRLATLEDAAGIAETHRISWEESYRGLLPDALINDMQRPGGAEARWEKNLGNAAQSGRRTLVAVVEGAVVGFGGSGPARMKELGCRGEIYAMYLRESHQKLGIGRALWQAAVADLKEQGLLPGYVWVLADNPTLEFYRHMGAQELHRRPCHFPDTEHLEEVALRFDAEPPDSAP